jgi:hypothetical protein
MKCEKKTTPINKFHQSADYQNDKVSAMVLCQQKYLSVWII